VEVEVDNQLSMQAISIHWHGLLMSDTPWMDGMAGITQYAIPPLHTFTYTFLAEPPGTHWYHSHVANQRTDGLYGAFIIHPVHPLPLQHVLMVSWFCYLWLAKIGLYQN
jgi:FtsP/CotA-like multicopper oxidase with cupredoxin domain